MNMEAAVPRMDLKSMYDYLGSGLFADNKFKSILLIEDDPDFAAVLKSHLESQPGIRVKVAKDPYEATDALTEKCYDLVIADWALPPFNASNAIQQADNFLRMDPLLPLKWTYQRVPVLLISGQDHTKELKHLKPFEHFELVQFLLKQSGIRKIANKVKRLLGHKRLGKIPKLALAPTTH
ncbi:MAG: PleD family two-component system response regulator [Bdellovibrionales bacterium]